MSENTKVEKVLGVTFGIVVFILLELGVAWLLMFLWNALIPGVFHGPSLTYVQVLIGYVLLTIVAGLFKGSMSSK